MKDNPKKFTDSYQHFWRNYDARLARARLTMDFNQLQNNHNLSPIRKRLFNDDNNDGQNTSTFTEQMQVNLQEGMRKWNFDFKRELPRAGNYQWVKLDKDGKEISTSSNETNMQKETENGTRRSREDDESKEGATKKFKGTES